MAEVSSRDRYSLHALPLSLHFTSFTSAVPSLPISPHTPICTLLTLSQHVGVRRYHVFLNQVYNLLEDDGTFFFQVSGIRARWQFEDLVW